MTIKETPTVIVVIGATGDLMQKKLTPAFFHLFENMGKACITVEKIHPIKSVALHAIARRFCLRNFLH